MAGHLLVVDVFQAKDPPALGNRPQVADIALHLGQGHQGGHHAVVAHLIHSLDLGPPGVEVAQDVAHKLLGHGDGVQVDRLQQHRSGILDRQLEYLATGDLEGNVLRVHGVLLAIIDGRQHVHHRIAGDDALGHDRLYPLVDGGAKGLGHVHAHHFPGKLVARVALERLDTHVHLGKLAGATRLLLVAILGPGLAGDGLFVGHARYGRIQAQAKGVFHTPDGDVDVRVAHARQNGLAGAVVLAPGQGWILLVHAGQCGADLGRVGLGLGRDRYRVERVGKDGRLQLQGHAPVAQGVAGLGFAEPGHAADITGRDPGGGELLLAADGIELTCPLLFAGPKVVDPRIGFERAGIDAKIGQLAHVGIGHRLEHQGGQVARRIGLELRGGIGRRVDGRVGTRVHRRGQDVDDGLHQGLHADVQRR